MMVPGDAGAATGRSDGGVARVHRMGMGAEVIATGGVRFRLWAPAVQRVQLELDGSEELLTLGNIGRGWHELTVEEARAGTKYRFVLPHFRQLPDPVSRFQPEDVHGPSEVIDPAAYRWGDAGWRGRPWHEAVVYELHVGSFTKEGTFRAAISKLEHLQTLGVTAIEIMPIADFPGRWNWGYDGAFLYAPDSSYGRPEDLKALVDAAHGRGISVMLDVVYNHFGPEGNYLPSYAPEAYTSRHKTPWGDAINYDGPHSGPVRELMIHNALYWLEEYHMDGLRLDAVHAIVDDGPEHVLEELARRARDAIPDRPVHLVLENEENSAARLRRENGRSVAFSAQWNDDVHHGLHVAATDENAGYYSEYHGDTEKLGRALAEGFAFQGEMMGYRGSPRGEVSAHLPPGAFVTFIQNHDQVGNRAYGDRLSSSVKEPALRAIASVYLLLPQVPMLFMGEEWATRRPFPFFCDFHGELAEAVSEGRRQEFAGFAEFQDEFKRARIPDPQAETTFVGSKLDWESIAQPGHAEWLDWYRRALEVRRREIVPLLARIEHGGTFEVLAEGVVTVRWMAGDQELRLAANLSARAVERGATPDGRLIWREGPGALGAWSVEWVIAPAA